MSAIRGLGLLATCVLAWRLIGCGGDSSNDAAPPTIGPDAATDASDALAPPITPEAQSGHRLRAVYWDVDGAKQSVIAPNGEAVFFDTKLGEECAFTAKPDSAGLDHCLPLASLTNERPDHYADPACSEAVAHRSIADPTCPLEPPRYLVMEENHDDCATLISVHHVGTKLSAGYSHDPTSNACVVTPFIEEESYRFGDEIPLTDFVSAKEVPSATGAGSIVPLDLVADDGARQRLLGWSTQNAMPYTVSYDDTLATVGWAPARLALWGDYFVDSACTQSAALAVFDCQATAATSSPSSVADVRSLGAAFTGEVWVQPPGEGCVPYSNAQNDGERYVLGPPLPSATLPSSIVETGSGRLHPLYTATPDGVPLLPFYPYPTAPTVFMDTARNEKCVLTAVDNEGNAVCVPPISTSIDNGVHAPLFDASCGAPVVVFRYRAPNAAVPTAFNVGSPLGCPGVPPLIRSIGAQLTPDACAVGTASSPVMPGDQVYALGDIIPLSAFATAKRVRE